MMEMNNKLNCCETFIKEKPQSSAPLRNCDKYNTLEATIEKSSVVGNMSKMREALLKAIVVLKDAKHYILTEEYVNECLALICSALSEPPRNCDCHLAKNLIGAVTLYCTKNPELPPMVEWNAIQYLEFCKWLFAEDKED